MKTRHVFPLLLLTALLGACGGDDAESQLRKARELQAENKLRDSLIALKSAAQASPDNPEIRRLLAETYLRLNKPNEAIKEFEVVAGMGGRTPEVELGIARARNLRGDYQIVLDTLSLDSRRPVAERARILQLRGDALFGLGKTDLACPLYGQALALDGKLGAALLGQGSCALAQGRPDEARRRVADAIRLDPANPDHRLVQARMELALRQPEKALAACEQAKKLAADSADAKVCKIRSLLALRRADAAEAELKLLREAHPKFFMAAYFEAAIALQRNQAQHARDLLQNVLKVAPQHSESQFLMALAQRRLNEITSATDTLKKLLAREPGSRPARLLLASILLESGDPGAAYAQLAAALDQHPSAAELGLAGQALRQLGRSAEAKLLFERAARVTPGGSSGLPAELAGEARELASQSQIAQALNERLRTLVEKGQAKQALQEVETLIRQRPDQASLYQARGGVLYALKRYPEARADFERVLKTEPGNVQVIRSLYALDLRENKRDAARERLKKALAAQPDNGDLLVAAAEDALLDNRLADAATLARRATKVKPSALEPQNILIREALAAGRTRQALEIATAYAERHPGQPLAALLLANTRLTAGEPLLALSSYNDLLKKQPANPLLNLLQARALLALGRQGEARSALKRVLVRLPDNYDALAMLAGIEASSGDEAAVKRILDQLDRLHPGSGLIAALRADLAFQMRRYEQALALYQKINATRPRPELQLRIAQSLARLGRGQEADRLLAEAVNKQPGAQVLRQAYADRLIALGKQAEAIRHYEYLIRIQPNSPLALNNLASLLQENQPERALKLATQAYELAPNVPAFADTYGWALTRAGRHEQSLNPLLRARDKLPADPAVRYHLAAALAELGRTKDARAELAVALAAPQPFSERAAAETLAKRLKTAK